MDASTSQEADDHPASSLSQPDNQRGKDKDANRSRYATWRAQCAPIAVLFSGKSESLEFRTRWSPQDSVAIYDRVRIRITPTFDPDELVATALAVAAPFSCSYECTAGSVGAAALTDTGEVFTGVCIDARCGLGFCAEHAVIAEMLKRRLTHIVAIAAVSSGGQIMPPCGRCRELIRQIDPANWETNVVVAPGVVVRLADLLPHSGPVRKA